MPPESSHDARIAAATAVGEASLPEELDAATEPIPSTLPAGPRWRQVLVLALPMLGEQVGVFLVGFVDTLLAGRINKEATTAVGAGGYMGWFVSMAFMLVSTGAAALVARSLGARDRGTAARVLNQSLLLALLVGAAVSLGVLLAAPLLAQALTQTPLARLYLTQYVRIDALGYAAFGVMLVLGGALRAAGDTRTPMVIMLLVNIVNAVVSASLVFGWLGLPRLEVLGIAIGTVVARTLGGLLMVAVLIRGLRGLQLRRALLRPHGGVLARIMRVGLPAAGEAGLLWCGQMGFILVVTHSAVGDEATVNFAAHTIAMRLEAISYLPAVAWMTAAATLVGQYLGARRASDASGAGHVAAMQAGALTALVGVAFFLLAEPLYRLMSDDAQVIARGAETFRWLGCIQPFLGMAIVYIGALRGAGDTRTMMLFSLIGSIGLRIPVAWLGGIALDGGLLGCWAGMWADNLAKFSMGLGRFAQGGWKRIRV